MKQRALFLLTLLLATLGNPHLQLSDAFDGSMTLNSMLEGPAQYPEPGRHNRAPDYEARAASFRRAINTEGRFEKELRERLLSSLERQFAHLAEN